MGAISTRVGEPVRCCRRAAPKTLTCAPRVSRSRRGHPYLRLPVQFATSLKNRILDAPALHRLRPRTCITTKVVQPVWKLEGTSDGPARHMCPNLAIHVSYGSILCVTRSRGGAACWRLAFSSSRNGAQDLKIATTIAVHPEPSHLYVTLVENATGAHGETPALPIGRQRSAPA